MISIQFAKPEHWREVAHLIYDSTNSWYLKNRGFTCFSGDKDCALLFCRTYAALDGPDNLIIAWDTERNRIAGSCFVHPRPTHVSLGIMNVHPDYFGQSVAPKILQKIIEIASSRNQTLRLVSSAMNLDSFSLYSRLGFVPHTVFQDMQFPDFRPEFIESRLPAAVSGLLPFVRPARLEDVPRIVELDKKLTGLDHTRDFTYFIQNPDGAWRTWVVDASNGIQAVLSSVCDPGSTMLGPGIMENENQMLALIFTAYLAMTTELPVPAKPVFLVPSLCNEAIQTLYSWGARNTEIHLGQALGKIQPAAGIVMPTFMPET